MCDVMMSMFPPKRLTLMRRRQDGGGWRADYFGDTIHIALPILDNIISSIKSKQQPQY